MKAVFFYHSLVSDWNHGNAHFLRGILAELQGRGHDAKVFEPHDSWSRENLLAEQGPAAIQRFRATFPELEYEIFSPDKLDLDLVLGDADLVLVHEWNDPELVARVGHWRHSQDRCLAFFHDTHHRSITAPDQMRRYDLSGYDGVLTFGDVIRRIYLENGWASRVWTWHEAADARVFQPLPNEEPLRDVLWIGNWGDDERSAELEEFLLKPIRDLRLSATIFGVGYPPEVLRSLANSDIAFGGWLPNFEAPRQYSRHLLALHVPRRPYVEALPGIPTIRPFEAMACARPLLCSPWTDAEGLFSRGRDHLAAADGREMCELMRRLLTNPQQRAALAQNAFKTIRARHTCGHRVDELLRIAQEVRRPVHRTEGRETVIHG